MTELPPPPQPWVPPPRWTSAPTRARPDLVAGIFAIGAALVGWLVWAFAWLAESDTGYPDGTACTAHAATSETYASCLYNSERSGAIVWALTFSAAVFGLVAVLRVLIDRQRRAGQDRWSALAVLPSGLLATVDIIVWSRGATGAYYEDRTGPTIWHAANIVALLVGAGVGWLVARVLVGRGGS